MTPVFHPILVNTPFGDPCVFVDFLYSRRAFLFDLGTLTGLPTRKILRVSHIFVSHAHIDHFIGFGHLVRLCLGREKCVHIFGPPGFVDRVYHYLASFTWNLVSEYPTDFTVVATEIHPKGRGLSSEFHCQRGFEPEKGKQCQFPDNIIHAEEGFHVRVAFLDHKIPSLAFSLEEQWHVNIMKNRLVELGLAVGPWLKDLKGAILRGDPDNTPIPAMRQVGQENEIQLFTVGELRERVVRVVTGQKVCYVTDAAFTPDNAEKIIALVHGADYLFIEATFLDAEADRAAERYHLTARQAGELARSAGATRVIPFHFSPKYGGREWAIRNELAKAWD